MDPTSAFITENKVFSLIGLTGKESRVHVMRMMDFEGESNEEFVRTRADVREYQIERSKGKPDGWKSSKKGCDSFVYNHTSACLVEFHSWNANVWFQFRLHNVLIKSSWRQPSANGGCNGKTVVGVRMETLQRLVVMVPRCRLWRHRQFWIQTCKHFSLTSFPNASL